MPSPRAGTNSVSRWLVIVVSVAVMLGPVVALASAETDSARVDRLFLWASAGEVRFRDRVEPAKDSLIKMGATGAQWLAPKLRTTDARERLTLGDLYEKIGPVATPYVVQFLDSAGEDMPKNAARCLGRIADTASVEPLLARLNHGLFAVRSEIATALGKIHDARAAESLIEQLSTDTDGDVRKSCAVALGAIGDQRAADLLLDALDDPFFGARQSAQSALGQIKPLPVAGLIETIANSSGLTRDGAIVALGGCDDPKARRYLLKLLDSDDPYVRGFAVEALGIHPQKDGERRIARLKKRETHPFVLAQIDRFTGRD